MVRLPRRCLNFLPDPQLEGALRPILRSEQANASEVSGCRFRSLEKYLFISMKQYPAARYNSLRRYSVMGSSRDRKVGFGGKHVFNNRPATCKIASPPFRLRNAFAFFQRLVADFSSVGRCDLGLGFYCLNERLAVLRRAEHDAS